MNDPQQLANKIMESPLGDLIWFVLAALAIFIMVKVLLFVGGKASGIVAGLFKMLLGLAIIAVAYFALASKGWINHDGVMRWWQQSQTQISQTLPNKVLSLDSISQWFSPPTAPVAPDMPAAPVEKHAKPITPRNPVLKAPAPVAQTTQPLPNVFQKYAQQVHPQKPLSPAPSAEVTQPLPNVFQKYAKQVHAPNSQHLSVFENGDTKHGYFTSTNCQTAQPIPTEHITVSVNLTCVGNCEHKVETGQIWTTPTGKLCQTTRVKSQ